MDFSLVLFRISAIAIRALPYMKIKVISILNRYDLYFCTMGLMYFDW